MTLRGSSPDAVGDWAGWADKFRRLPAPASNTERALVEARQPGFLASFRVGFKRAIDAQHGDGHGGSTHAAVAHWIRLILGSLGLNPIRPVDPISPLRLKLCELDLLHLYGWWCVAHLGVSYETAKGYVGTVDSWHRRYQGVGLAGDMGTSAVYRMLDGYARDVGVPPERIKRLGVRPRDLGVGIDQVFTTSSAAHANRAALLQTATVGVLRGGDGISLGARKLWDAAVCCNRGDVSFQFGRDGRPTACRLMAINCKAKGVEAKRKLPRYLPMRGKYLSPGDLLYYLTEVVDYVPPESRTSTPLFRDPATNKILSIETMRADVRRCMSAAGRDGSLYGAHSCRIGGATAMNFEHAPAETIKAAGAWSSDAYLAYLRACGKDVLSIGQAICSSDVDDLATDYLDVDQVVDDDDFS